jgi:hypothetical protein
MTKFLKLFEIKFFHHYYDTFSAKDFTIFPSKETNELLRSYGILFKQTNEGFVLIYNQEKESLLVRLKEEISFFFAIKIKNKYFHSFSDVEVTSETKKYYFGNGSLSGKEKENDKNVQLKINSDIAVNKKDVYLCSYNNLEIKDLLGNGKVLVEHNDNLLYEGELEDRLSAGSILTNGYGMYDFSIDAQELKLLHLPESFLKEYGIIELVLGGKSSFDEVKGSEYQVHFASREIQWNYYFISNSKLVYDSIDIFSGKEKLSFSKPELTTLINGQQALKVSSETLFPLKQRYNGKNFIAELKATSDGNPVNKKVNLITPDLTRVKGKREEDKEIYFSDMYVYL